MIGRQVIGVYCTTAHRNRSGIVGFFTSAHDVVEMLISDGEILAVTFGNYSADRYSEVKVYYSRRIPKRRVIRAAFCEVGDKEYYKFKYIAVDEDELYEMAEKAFIDAARFMVMDKVTNPKG